MIDKIFMDRDFLSFFSEFHNFTFHSHHIELLHILLRLTRVEFWSGLTYSLDFQLGPEAGSSDGRAKKIALFLFHPFLPLALSIQQTSFLQPSVVNIHFRR
jgi:hypothetical protein